DWDDGARRNRPGPVDHLPRAAGRCAQALPRVGQPQELHQGCVRGSGFRRLTMDRLTAFGLFAVTAMLVFYALEHRSRWFVLAFAGSCVLASAYGFLQGA